MPPIWGRRHQHISCTENAYDAADNDSVGSITQRLTSMYLTNNANAQSIHDTMSAIIADTAALCAALIATQQQLMLFTQAQPAAPWENTQMPPPAPPPGYIPPAYATPPPATTIPPPTYQIPANQKYGDSGHGGGRDDRGDGQEGKKNGRGRQGVEYGAQPPAAGSVPCAVGTTANFNQ